jgi:hypothetical protein
MTDARVLQLLPVTEGQLARIDQLIEHLLELRDILDGDPDHEPEPDEDGDADEWSAIIVYDREGNWRWA